MQKVTTLKEALDKMLVKHLKPFRDKCMKQCNWTGNQWRNRLSDRTPLTALEVEVVNNILSDLLKDLE